MANYVAITGIIDQVGGSIFMPPSETHIPRYQGNFFTLPAGLQIKGNRKYVWSVNTTLPGVIAITNVNTPTPTIQFDSNIYSGVSLRIRCTIVGQPRNFIEYTLFTASTSSSQTSLQLVSRIDDNNYFNVTNINIFSQSDVIIPNTNNYFLAWSAPKYLVPLNYLVQIWNDGWTNFTLTPNSIIPITNPNTSYRVKALFLNSEIQSQFINYGLNYFDRYLLGSSNITVNINSFNNILNFNQILNPLPLFSSVEIFNSNSNIVSRVVAFNSINNYNQNLFVGTFFSSVETFLGASNINSYINSFNTILNFNQNISNNPFWSEPIGA